MASILVYIETNGDLPASVSLAALGEGRRIATRLGACLNAFAAARNLDTQGTDALFATLRDQGADRVVLTHTSARRPGPPGWSSDGAMLFAACEQIMPGLILLAPTTAGCDIAPRLAARLGATFVASATFEQDPPQAVTLAHRAYGATYRRLFTADDLRHLVVATVAPSPEDRAVTGDGDFAQLIELPDTGSDATRSFAAGESVDDPGGALECARTVVLAGAGIDSRESWALVQELAALLGGEAAATRSLCQRGLAPPDREVGVGARRIAPSLFVVVAASGSSASLGALVSNPRIVAINSDRKAPIFRVASHGIIGELQQVLPALITALRTSATLAATS